MNTKSIVFLISICVLVLLFFLLKRNTGNTLTGDDRNFEFQNISKIDKVFLSNKLTHKYALLKKTGERMWTVNDSFQASIYKIDILLETLQKMKVKRPASKHEIERVKKDIALNGTKVEIYENNTLSKVFYVGNNTSDEMGTYFIMENAKEPYVCHIPGFNGFLNPRFFTNLDGWRSKSIFSVKETDIKSIQIDWIEKPQSSFVINNEKAEPLFMVGNKILKNNVEVNRNNIKAYLNSWENLSFEGFPIDLSPHQIDSISKTLPILTILLIDKKGKSTFLSIHKKGIKRDSKIQFDEEGNPLQFDIETFYAFINKNHKELVQIQDYVFGKVMKESSDFLIKK